MIGGISKPSFYRVINAVADAINKCPHLQCSFPADDHGPGGKLQQIALDFSAKSTEGVMRGCVGAIDGYLLLTSCPSLSEVDSVHHYFSGHYYHYGLNIQALVDAKCRFMEVHVAAPGAASDSFALSECKGLVDKIESLPFSWFIVGDNAYTQSEHLVVPFFGDNRETPRNDAFNFHLSQLRIKVEQGFGLLTSKFHILRRPISMKLKNVSPFFLALTKIHNFCIDERTPTDSEPSQVMYTFQGNQMLYVPSDIRHFKVPGISLLREHLVQRIEKRTLSRPGTNRSRNRK